MKNIADIFLSRLSAEEFDSIVNCATFEDFKAFIKEFDIDVSEFIG